MKKLNNIFLIFIGLVLFTSCKDEEAVRVPELGTGPNVRFQWDPQYGFINFDELETTFVRYDLFSESTDLESVELEAVYTQNTGETDTVLIRSYTQADFDSNDGAIYDVDIPATELAEAFGITINDLQGGDSFTFNNYTTLTDGSVYPSPTVNGNDNVAPGIVGNSATASFTTTYTAYVGCPSDQAAFEGEYTSEIIASNYGGFVGATNNDVTITFVGPEPFRYEVSDISALAYAPFGGGEYPGDIYDICGTPLGLTTSTFGSTSGTGGGTWDPEAGVLTLNYFESFNGLSWTIVFTKKTEEE